MRKVIFILIIILVSRTCVSGEDGITMAVMNMEARNASESDAVLVADSIRDGLSGTGGIKVLGREPMEEVLLKNNFTLSGCTSRDCAVKSGKLLDVGQVVVGNLSRLGDKYYISARVVDVGDGAILAAETGECASAEGLKEAAELIGRKISGVTGGPLQEKGITDSSEKDRLGRVLDILRIQEKYYRREIRNSWFVAGFGLFLGINGLVWFRGEDRLIFEALGGGLIAIGAASLGRDYGRLGEIRRDINVTLVRINIAF